MSAGPIQAPSSPDDPVLDLGAYDWVLINTSAGKDSQAMLDYLVELADSQGVGRSRLIAVHCDLGRVEWEGTRELAGEQAAHYGLRFEVVRNRNWADLLERIESRGKWPDAKNRYCTSEFKTAQVKRLATRLVAETSVLGRPVRILNCLGLRAEESPTRAKKAQFRHLEARSGWSNTKRSVDEWLPIHSWGLADVWGRINRSGVPHHPAYDMGMPRLSCSFCVLASRGALVRAATLRPGLAAEYAAAESRMGHRFRQDLSMADIIAAAERETVESVEDWVA